MVVRYTEQVRMGNILSTSTLASIVCACSPRTTTLSRHDDKDHVGATILTKWLVERQMESPHDSLGNNKTIPTLSNLQQLIKQGISTCGLLLLLGRIRLPVGVQYNSSTYFPGICKIRLDRLGDEGMERPAFLLRPADHLRRRLMSNAARINESFVTFLILHVLNSAWRPGVGGSEGFAQLCASEARSFGATERDVEQVTVWAQKIFNQRSEDGRMQHGPLPCMRIPLVSDRMVQLVQQDYDKVLRLHFGPVHLVIPCESLLTAMLAPGNKKHVLEWMACENPLDMLLNCNGARNYLLRTWDDLFGRIQHSSPDMCLSCYHVSAIAMVAMKWERKSIWYSEDVTVNATMPLRSQIEGATRRLATRMAATNTRQSRKRKWGVKRSAEDVQSDSKEIEQTVYRKLENGAFCFESAWLMPNAIEQEVMQRINVGPNNHVLWVKIQVIADPCADKRMAERHKVLCESKCLPPDLLSLVGIYLLLPIR